MEETQPSAPIVIAAALFPEADTFLRAHGCTVDITTRYDGTIDDHIVRTIVTLPQGSRRTLIVRAASERWLITLPDNIQLRQVYDPSSSTSTLDIPAQRVEEGRDEQQ